ncbi:GNAT family N-acetyltransferase [bacterium]|nr:GNAT family N-acetyltransferase [bacterium]
MALPILDAGETFLRAYEREDFEDFAALMSDPQATLHTDGPMPVAAVARLFEQLLVCDDTGPIQAWAVVHRARQEFLGHCGLRRGEREGEVELLLMLSPRHWRKGYGLAAARRLIEYATTATPYTKVIGTVDPDHEASIALMTRLGMSLERWEEDTKGKYLVYAGSLERGK